MIEVAGIIGNEAIGATIQTLTGGLLGAVAPSLLGVKLSFQQKRFERNMISLMLRRYLGMFIHQMSFIVL